ncbi:uncharacterized protein A1O9_06707 [Exophiala aquamarina CBS 119918]|uniref:Uncharacterized protein n=1 Tax=Exophiala aquamarina CBS 119918 TaxID=1182545 RepID=A0A072PLU9_9EURO|nr:uncharacterized protein A1O9_06707 [Exophiala aquamarina CBS 119918]KEF56520.1 hypothetical protein A1O9_06707 [Exophiala aquamarina CBS 119918]
MSSRISSLFLLALLVAATMFPTAASLRQQTPSTIGTPTSTQSLSDTHAVACVTGGGDWHMDPLIAERLSTSFCTRLLRPEVFPQPGIRAEGSGYPSDLGIVDDGDGKSRRMSGVDQKRVFRLRDIATDSEADISAIINTTLIEISGAVAEFMFYRSKTETILNTEYVRGTDEQCARDDCAEGFRRAVNTCKFNSHHIGGFAAYLTDCGLYSILVQNCSSNYVDRDCNTWHERWPDVGLKENMTLVWNITHGIGVNGSGSGKAVEDEEGEHIPDLRGIAERFAYVKDNLPSGGFWVDEWK